MARNFVQPGETLDFVNRGAQPVAAGDVVVAGTLLGVALVDIAPGASGSVALTGVFACAKPVGVAIDQGARLIFEIDSQQFGVDFPAGVHFAGPSAVAFAAASAEAETVHVRFTGVSGSMGLPTDGG